MRSEADAQRLTDENIEGVILDITDPAHVAAIARVAFPTYGAYAVEAFSDVLRREVGRYGVQVIVVEPGTVNSGMWEKGLTSIHQLGAEFSAGASAPQKARYSDLLAAVTKQAEANVRNGTGVDPRPRRNSDRRRGQGSPAPDALPHWPRRQAPGLLSDRAFDRVVATNLGLRKPSAGGIPGTR